MGVPTVKRNKHQSAAESSPVRNDILRALLGSEYRDLRPKLERVELKVGEIVYLWIKERKQRALTA